MDRRFGGSTANATDECAWCQGPAAPGAFCSVCYFGDDNNVNIRLTERDWEEIIFGGRVIYSPVTHTRWSYNSPDNREFWTTYNVYPNILTQSLDRFGNANDFVSMEAIFDVTLGPDDRCSDGAGPV